MDGDGGAPFGTLVGGGSSGIGKACAERLLRAGAHVTIAGLEESEVQAAVEQLAAIGPPVEGVAGDLTEPEHARAVVDRAAALAPLRVLVNSTGIQRYGTVETTEVAEWDRVMAVNVRTAFLLAKFAVPHLRQGGGGSIVNVASVQAFATQQGVAAYAASKSALVGLTRAMAVDYAREGFRANAVCPGSVDTPMLRWAADRFAGGRSQDELVAQWGNMHPMGRVATAAEVAEAVWYLASPAAAFVTGTELRVDGGLLAALAVAVEG